MPVTDRELWALNFFRNSELHGALLMGRLARSLSDTMLLAHATTHCATEARHAAMLSQVIVGVGGQIDPRIQTVQEWYSRRGGIPTALVDLLVLSEVLEKRVLVTYRAYLERDDVHSEVRATLTAIVGEMEREQEEEHAGWIDAALDAQPHDAVENAERRWREIDGAVVKEIEDMVNIRFPQPESRS
jgi:bacterioferritin (cytochrome b1)